MQSSSNPPRDFRGEQVRERFTKDRYEGTLTPGRSRNAARLAASAVGLACLGLAVIAAAGRAQVVSANGDVAQTLRFPARGGYKNPGAVFQNYDAISDVTRLRLGISSGNPLTLLLKPIVQLDFEATYNGAQPSAAPDSIVMTGRVFRLLVSRQQPGTVTSPGQPMQLALAQQPPTAGPGVPGPLLSFMVAPPSNAGAPTSDAAWRTSLASTVTASNQVVAADDTGIWFRGQRWLSTIANIIDLSRKRGELPLNLVARSDTGRFSLGRLPERVRNVLHDGLRITITEDVHRLAIPVSALVQMANAPEGVKSRFGTVDFAIDGDQFNALQDFVSRLAPKEGVVAMQMAQAPTPPAQTPPASSVAVPSGTAQSVGTPPPVASSFAAQSVPVTPAPQVGPAPSSSTADPAAGANIPVGTEIELLSSTRRCSDSVNVGEQFTASVAKPIQSPSGARVDSGTAVLLMVSDIQRGAQDTDPIHVRMSAVSITLGGRVYGLHGSVVKSSTVKETAGAHSCVPANGKLVLRLSRPLQMPR